MRSWSIRHPVAPIAPISMVLCVLGMASPVLAQSPADQQGCPNCEAKVVLDAADVQAFTDLMIGLDSLPLHVVVLDPGVPGGSAQVLVATYPDYAASHSVDLFDVARKVIGFAWDPRFGIRSVTATWTPPAHGTESSSAPGDWPTYSNVGTIGH